MLRFLIAVDGSTHALRAVRAVAELARLGLPLEAIVCHVKPPVLSGEVGIVAPVENAELRLRAEGEAALASAQAVLADANPDVKATSLLLSGDAGEELARAAREWNCETIVVGRHGRGRLGAALLGSVSAAVARLAAVPVMVVT